MVNDIRKIIKKDKINYISQDIEDTENEGQTETQDELSKEDEVSISDSAAKSSSDEDIQNSSRDLFTQM